MTSPAGSRTAFQGSPDTGFVIDEEDTLYDIRLTAVFDVMNGIAGRLTRNVVPLRVRF